MQDFLDRTLSDFEWKEASAPRRLRVLPPSVPVRGNDQAVREDERRRADAPGLMAKLEELRGLDATA